MTSWAMPEEPGAEVTTIYDADGGEWTRLPDGGWTADDGDTRWAWDSVLFEFGPLVDQLHEPK